MTTNTEVTDSDILDAARRGMSDVRIAKELGVTRHRAMKVAFPDRYERHLATSREAKYRHTGTCVDCGGETKYSGAREPSKRCSSCARQKISESRKWNRETIIDAILRWANEHGRPPRASDWVVSDREKRYPNIGSVYGRPGSPFQYWGDAIEAAGFTTKRSRPIDIDRMCELYASGMSYQKIANEIGCSVAGVAAALKRIGVEK